MWLTCVRACLVLDESSANPSAGFGGPNGDIFSADITSPERPLIRSQSFHNSPGKWPLGLSLRSQGKEASHCLLFQHTEKYFQSSGKEYIQGKFHSLINVSTCTQGRLLVLFRRSHGAAAIPTPQSPRLCLPCSRASWVITSLEGSLGFGELWILSLWSMSAFSTVAIVGNICLPAQTAEFPRKPPRSSPATAKASLSTGAFELT